MMMNAAMRAFQDNEIVPAAAARRADVLHDVGNGVGAYYIANNVRWYFSRPGSWGFAPADDTVSRRPCDTNALNSDDRLCWVTTANGIAPNGRCGSHTGQAWRRIILHK